MLQVKNLCKTFNENTANEKRVFSNFSIDVNAGDFITIIGSNGSGKSTLLNLISGTLLQDAGSIFLDKEEISMLSEYKRSRNIGRVFQNPSMGTSPSMTILENLSLALNKGKRFDLSLGISKNNISFFHDLLQQLSLGLENQMETRVNLLSGGQRQALTLLMAVMSNPKLLLLDEHTAALDPKTSDSIIDLTEKLVNDKHITTLMITHNLQHAVRIGNRLIMMDQGKIILDVNGEEKKNLTTEKLLNYFSNLKAESTLSDRVLLS